MYYRMTCPRCWRRIEYTDLQAGHFSYCKHCNQEVLLRGNPFRISMYLIGIAVLAFSVYGGIRLFRMIQKESRYSSAIYRFEQHHKQFEVDHAS